LRRAPIGPGSAYDHLRPHAEAARRRIDPTVTSRGAPPVGKTGSRLDRGHARLDALLTKSRSAFWSSPPVTWMIIAKRLNAVRSVDDVDERAPGLRARSSAAMLRSSSSRTR
jgi:hypothetical protein